MGSYKPLFLFVSVLFLIGLLFGIVLEQALPLQQQEQLKQLLDEFFRHYPAEGGIGAKEYFLQSSLGHAKVTAAIFLLGLTVIGLPVVLLFLFTKGMMLGFTAAFLIDHLRGKGIYLVLFAVLPQNLLIVPALALICASSIAFGLYLFRNRILRYHGKLLPPFLSYVILNAGLLSLLLAASLYETFLAPQLLERAIRFALN